MHIIIIHLQKKKDLDFINANMRHVRKKPNRIKAPNQIIQSIHGKGRIHNEGIIHCTEMMSSRAFRRDEFSIYVCININHNFGDRVIPEKKEKPPVIQNERTVFMRQRIIVEHREIRIGVYDDRSSNTRIFAAAPALT